MEPVKRLYTWWRRPRKTVMGDYAQSLITIVIAAFIIRTWGFGLYQVPTCSMETTMLVGERFFADKFSILFSKPKHGEIISFNDPRFPYAASGIKHLWQHYVWGPSNWTKRVIGVPGDHVKGVIEDGKPVVYRNGVKLNEPYLNKYPIIAVYTHNPLDIYTHRSYDPNKSYSEQPFYKLNENDVFLGERLLERFGKINILYPGTPAVDETGKILDEFDVKLGKNQYWAMGDNRLGSYDSRAWGPLEGSLIHGKIVFRIWSLDSDQSWWILDLLKHPIDFWKRIRWSRCIQFVH